MEQMDLGREPGEIERFLERGVAAADDRDLPVAKEEPIARRARRDATAAETGLAVVTHARNRGYGAALSSAIAYALQHEADVLVTMDCDGQHEPSRIPVLLEAIHDADIVSGSRYLRDFRQDTLAPQDRRRINDTRTPNPSATS